MTRRGFFGDSGFAGALLMGLLVWAALARILPLASPSQWQIDLWQAFAFCLLYPLLEELTFRGGLQGYLLDRGWGGLRLGPLTAANACTTLAFAALHLQAHSPGWALAVIPPSLVFGLLRERHGSVRPAVALHVIYNSGYYLLFVVGVSA